MVWGTDWEFSQDTGVNTPTHTINAMRSVMTSESQVPRLMSHLKDSTLYRAVSPITALGTFWDIFFDQRLNTTTGPPTPLPAGSGLPSRNWPGPTLLSFRSKPAVVCRVVCCWQEWVYVCGIVKKVNHRTHTWMNSWLHSMRTKMTICLKCLLKALYCQIAFYNLASHVGNRINFQIMST